MVGVVDAAIFIDERLRKEKGEREKGERVAELREREREFARDSEKSAGKGERGSLPGFNEARDNYKRKHKRILLTRE